MQGRTINGYVPADCSMTLLKAYSRGSPGSGNGLPAGRWFRGRGRHRRGGCPSTCSSRANKRWRLARRSQLCHESFFRAAKVLLYHMTDGLRTRLFRRQVGTIDVRATRFLALHDALSRKPVHDGHNCGVCARQPLGQTVPDFPDGPLPHGPEGIEAIKLQWRKIQKRTPGRARLFNT